MQAQNEAMTFDKTASAGYFANHMARLFAQRLNEGTRPLGIAPAQFVVLLELWAEDGLTQADLVGRLAVEQATMANTLARMERDGLITRQPHPTDKRSSVAKLTDKARSLADDATAVAKSVNDRALRNLAPEEIEQFLKTAKQIISALS